MGIIKRIFGGGKDDQKDEISKFEDETIVKKNIKLDIQSDSLIKNIKRTDAQIGSLMESSIGKSQSEKKRIAIRIKTLQDNKASLEHELLVVEQELRMGNAIGTHKKSDETKRLGYSNVIHKEKMDETLIKRRVESKERDEKISSLNNDMSRAINSNAIEDDTGDILDTLNMLDEGDLDPAAARKMLDPDLE